MVAFPIPFVAGAIRGVIDDIMGLARMVKSVFTGGIGDLVYSAIEVIDTMFSADAPQAGLRVGLEIGRSLGKEIVDASKLGILEFSFWLGRKVGPMIIYIVLAMVGVPEMIGATLGARLAEVLGPLLKNEPRIARLLDMLVRKMGHRPGLGPARATAAAHRRAQGGTVRPRGPFRPCGPCGRCRRGTGRASHGHPAQR
jgi:hypothetical protein